jgi:hypothetical protein
VKIIERGAKPPPLWMRDQWRCTRCKTIVQFEPGDEEFVQYDDEYEWHDGCAVVIPTCPVCGGLKQCFDRVKKK